MLHGCKSIFKRLCRFSLGRVLLHQLGEVEALTPGSLELNRNRFGRLKERRPGVGESILILWLRGRRGMILKGLNDFWIGQSVIIEGTKGFLDICGWICCGEGDMTAVAGFRRGRVYLNPWIYAALNGLLAAYSGLFANMDRPPFVVALPMLKILAKCEDALAGAEPSCLPEWPCPVSLTLLYLIRVTISWKLETKYALSCGILFQKPAKGKGLPLGRP